MKGWLIGMGWVVLCSANLGFASNSEYSSEIAKHSYRNKEGKRRAILNSALTGEGSKNSADLFPDLSPLYSVLIDDGTRDFAMGKGCYAKHHRNSLRLLWRYLFDILDEEFSEEECLAEKYSDEEDLKQKEDSQNEENNEELSDSLRQEKEFSEEEDSQEKGDLKKEEKDSEEEDWHTRCGKKLYPTATRLKKMFNTSQLLRMDIDLERLLEIESLSVLRKSRSFIPEEESLLDKAMWALDRSPERRLLDAIDSAAEDPEKALETAKSIIETEDVDINLPYEGFRVFRSSFLRGAAAIDQNKGLEIVRFLLDHGANIDLLDDGEMALHSAVMRKNTEVVKLLLDRGANVNSKVSFVGADWTPLHLALYLEDFEIARLLLDHGADPSIRDDDGKTPFDIAMKIRKQIGNETERREFDEALDELHLQTT